MSERDEVRTGNEEYLSAALKWLRLRLKRLAGQSKSTAILLPESTQDESATPPETPRRRLFRRQAAASFGSKPSNLTTRLLPPAPGAETITDEQVERAADVMRHAGKTEPRPPLLLLSKRFGLSRFEREVLLLCAAMELDTRIAHLCARAQDDPNKAFPTFALALVLFDDPAWDALAPEGPLRYWRLLQVKQQDAQPLTTSALYADERIVNYIKGNNRLDVHLSPFFMPLEVIEIQPELPPSQQELVDNIVRQVSREAASTLIPIIHLLGADAASKHLIALRAASELGLRLHRLPAELLPPQAAELETLSRLLQRESLLLPVALYLDAHELDLSAQAEGHPAQSLKRFLSRMNGVIFLDTRDVFSGLTRTTTPIDVTKPTLIEQRDAWAAALGLAAGDSPERLSTHFNLNLPTIGKIAYQELGQHGEDEMPIAIVRDQLWRACLMQTRPRLDHLAHRIEPKATWDDLVLPPVEKDLLKQIADQVRQRHKVYEDWGFARKMNRGLGISALFAGDSGTGKTMAAEVLAKTLDLNLYRIDLSAVVSKYIGETEKNLRSLFDAAEDGGVILFFDEADALYGKRSEVKDAHDRYANIEINYLLMRMEAFRGLAILATNMKSALDTAFVRRLRFILDFPFPGLAERKEIWRKVFPSRELIDSLDLDRLARLNLTGGNIHNVALNAAFMAAHANSLITMPLLLQAAEHEFRKLGRPISETDFQWEEPAQEVA
jgi:hypothetical protein